MQPLDLIKVRLQVSERSKQKDIWKSLLKKQEWKGMWRGLTTNIVGNSISWGGYFWLYLQYNYMNATSNNNLDTRK